jgi:DNA integrity scanning protein DisA with diadenylate cyclase activity
MRRRTFDFSGVGVIVCNRLESLPVFPLSKSQPSFERFDLVDQLLEIAARSSEYHDGFHVISDAWRLTSAAQYFSPPIIVGTPIDHSKRFGGRYLAALFGSAISEVKLTGIASEGFGIAIFQGGREVVFEDQK